MLTKNIFMSEWKIILSLSFFIGVILNSPVFFDRYTMAVDSVNKISAILIADILFTFFASILFVSLLRLSGSFISKFLIFGLLLFSVIAAYYMWFFGVVIGYGIVRAVFETDATLSIESVGYLLLIFIAIFALIPQLILFKTNVYPNHKLSRRILERLGLLGVAVLSLYAINAYYKSLPNTSANGQIIINPIGVATHSYLPTNWISAASLAMANMIANKKLESTRSNPFDTHTFLPTIDDKDIFLVVIIGESARGDRLSVLGAKNKTTPYLEQEDNLIAFQGKSCNTSTSLSLECMFVRKGGVEERGVPIQQLVYEGHLFQVLKGLGYSIDLFAMQSQVGFYSKVGADSFMIREEIGAEAMKNGINTIDDMLLIDQTEKSLQKNEKGKHVVILHQKGSHFLYSSRYPQEFAKFKPECKSIDANCTAKEMFNAYDNTILYTDLFIKNVIDLLRDKKAMLIYASDHGESIDAKTQFHATPKHIAPPEQLDIPILLWASDSMLSEDGIKAGFEAAREKSKKDIAQHEELFESILGCLGYKSPDGGIRAINNWCSGNVKGD